MLEDIKSEFILDSIFNNISNKLKLKIIKHNKNLLQKLNITIEDFKIYETLKKFNEDFNLDIKDIDIEELDLSHKRIGKKESDLNNNKTKDIQILERIKLKNLKILRICWNYISDIKVFENVNLNKLELLNLNYNYISDIKILENVNFP